MFNIYNSTKSWAQKKKLNVYFSKELDSTNTYAKNTTDNLDLVITEFQSSGKGRADNTWTSPNAGDGLLASFVFEFSTTPQPITTALVGLCLYQSLSEVFPDFNWSIKAPNDIWLDDKKIAGILCETLSVGDKHKLIIGVGANFLSHPNLDTATSFPKGEIKEKTYLEFLESFYNNLNTFSLHFFNSELSDEHNEGLLEALNNCSYYKSPILKLSSKCDIVFEDKTLSWYSL